MTKKKAKKSTAVAEKRMTLGQELKKNYFFYLIALPGVIYMILFNYIPMSGIYLAFENYTYQGGLFGSEFVGLRNFKFLLANLNNAIRATRNTLVVNIFGIVLGTALNVAVAIVLAEIRSERYRKFGQTIILFPHFLSWIVVGGISEVLLNERGGMINKVIEMFGGDPLLFNSEPKYWWAILILFSLWKGFGYGSLVYYATVTGFDPALYEAAEIDGAGRWKKITKITIPLLKPTIVTLFLLSIGGVMGSSLEQVMGMTKLNPLLLETTDNLATYVYRMGIGNGEFGLASALSLYQSVIGCVIVLAANLLAKKADPDYALF